MGARKGDWIQTFTGVAFWPLDPRPSEIDIEDIAHALANQCRFSGHTRQFYSVAQHCVVMARVVPDHAKLWALLHDASEAYLVDLPRPIKQLMPGYRDAEDAVMRAVCERFGLAAGLPGEVREADVRMLATEARDLLGPHLLPWASLDGVLPYDFTIVPTRPDRAKADFLHAFRALTA